LNRLLPAGGIAVSEEVVGLVRLDNPDVEPESDVLEVGDPVEPDSRLLVLVGGAPLDEPRPKLDAEEPTEGPASVPALERESVEVVLELIARDEPIVLEGVLGRSGLTPTGHGLWDVIVVEPAGGWVVGGVAGGG
jgi:hypothetical protein